MLDTQDTPAPAAPTGDTFFVLRDSRELFVRRVSEIIQQCATRDARILDAVRNEIGAAHDELVAAEEQEGFAGTRGLTASRISLVGHDDLELDIRIGEIASHLRDDERIDHWRAQLRYMALLQRKHMAPDENPVGMEPIRRALWILCRESGDGLDRQIDRLERIEEMLKLMLPDVYQEVNRLLESRGVQPAAVQLVRQGGGVRGSSQGGQDAGNAGGNSLAALQQTMLRQSAGNLPFSGTLAGGGTAAAGGFAMDANALVMLNHLLARLDAIEKQQFSSTPSSALGEGGDSHPPRPLRSGDLDLLPDKPTAVILDTLSAIFEAIFASPELPDALKALLGRLQIPLLKRAILDPQFFADTQHPARQLVSRLARAGIGLREDIARDHPLCLKLAEIADAARLVMEQKDGDLAPHLAALDALASRRDTAIQAAAQHYAAQVDAYERGETALACAQEWLQRTLARTREPAFVQFLSVHWVRLMQDACLAGGTEGEAWKDGAATIDSLLWSIEPKQTAEDRQKLTALIPFLVKQLNAGLDRLAVPQEQRKDVLDACFVLQTAALRGKSGAGEAAPPPVPPGRTPPVASPGTSPPARILEKDGKRVQYFGRPALPASPWRTGGPRTGDWLVFAMPDGTSLCGKICWEGPASHTYLVFNPEWGFAVALAPQIVQQQLQAGKARIASAGSLFDDAAEQALRTLRGRSET